MKVSRITGRSILTLKFLTPLATLIGSLEAAPVVPGFTVEVYASVPDLPEELSFDSAGNLYVGRDGVGADRPRQVSPGGGSVTPYGNEDRIDPDALIVDTTGSISGTPDAVLVGGFDFPNFGIISSIAPDQSVTQLFGPTGVFRNPNRMTFDNGGRLLFTDIFTHKVYSTTGLLPTELFSTPSAGPYHIAVDSSNRIFTTQSTGISQLNDSDGTLLNSTFASGLGSFTPLVTSTGGVWGTGLYAVKENDDLVRFDSLGNSTVVGLDFGDISDLIFGPDEALYAAHRPTGDIFRIALPPPDSDGDGVPDDQDICPDGDDNVDMDSDGVPDFCDPCPFDSENDADGDGVCGDVDACRASDFTPTVVADGCDSGVDNVLFDDGCTLADLIEDCAAGVRNHGDFVSCVAHLLNGLKKDGVISGKEKGAIQSCAARADIP